MPLFNKYTFSNILIILSLIFTIIGYLFPSFILEWSVNNFYLSSGSYFHFILQFFTGTFLHGGFMHFLMNAIFIYYFGNILETIIGIKKYISFFLLSVIFIGISVSYLNPYIYTIGISGFVMAIISYYTLELKSVNNIEYKGGITAIIISIGIGFYPGISLYGHLFGAIFGIFFFYLTNDFTKKQLVGLFKYKKREDKNSISAFNIKKD